jgi:hypothetical protein
VPRIDSPFDLDIGRRPGRRVRSGDTRSCGRYREAIAVFTKGVEQFPSDARFLRHRGHRYITTRQFGRAATDFERATKLVHGKPDEIEPDGQPNARNIPTGTLQFNIWYHLGLSYYLEGDLARAREAYERCIEVSRSADAQVATRHWLYMTLRRLGHDSEAKVVIEPITATGVNVLSDKTVIENASYHHLLLMYRGELTPEALLEQSTAALDKTTVTYGVANWHFYNGRRSEAVALLRTIVHGSQWAAFGSIAAEADLKRLGEMP